MVMGSRRDRGHPQAVAHTDSVVHQIYVTACAQMRLEVKKSRPVSKSYFKVVSKIKNAKFMQGTGRGKSRIE